MHGVIFHELKGFAETFGPSTWTELLKDAGLAGRLYLSAGSYDDADIQALVGAASRKLRLPVPQVLTAFGRYLGPRLLQRHARQVPPHWRTLDVLAHVEDTMHRAVRAQDKSAAPPALEVVRRDAAAVVIRYSSPRRMCALAAGLIEGIAGHYAEAVVVSQETCMERGDARCDFVVLRA